MFLKKKEHARDCVSTRDSAIVAERMRMSAKSTQLLIT